MDADATRTWTQRGKRTRTKKGHNGQGQRYKRIGTGTRTDTGGGTVTGTDRHALNRDRNRDTNGQGHKQTRAGKATQADSGQFLKILTKLNFNCHALNKFNNKHSSVKFTFLKLKMSAVPLINRSADTDLSTYNESIAQL
jgi:hypothetical protein